MKYLEEKYLIRGNQITKNKNKNKKTKKTKKTIACVCFNCALVHLLFIALETHTNSSENPNNAYLQPDSENIRNCSLVTKYTLIFTNILYSTSASLIFVSIHF